MLISRSSSCCVCTKDRYKALYTLQKNYWLQHIHKAKLKWWTQSILCLCLSQITTSSINQKNSTLLAQIHLRGTKPREVVPTFLKIHFHSPIPAWTKFFLCKLIVLFQRGKNCEWNHLLSTRKCCSIQQLNFLKLEIKMFGRIENVCDVKRKHTSGEWQWHSLGSLCSWIHINILHV